MGREGVQKAANDENSFDESPRSETPEELQQRLIVERDAARPESVEELQERLVAERDAEQKKAIEEQSRQEAIKQTEERLAGHAVTPAETSTMSRQPVMSDDEKIQNLNAEKNLQDLARAEFSTGNWNYNRPQEQEQIIAETMRKMESGEIAEKENELLGDLEKGFGEQIPFDKNAPAVEQSNAYLEKLPRKDAKFRQKISIGALTGTFASFAGVGATAAGLIESAALAPLIGLTGGLAAALLVVPPAIYGFQKWRQSRREKKFKNVYGLPPTSSHSSKGGIWSFGA